MAGELYSIEQARALLGGIARNTLYDLLRSGALASVPIGRRRFIASEAIAAFVAATSTTSAPLRPLRGGRLLSRATSLSVGVPRRRGRAKRSLGRASRRSEKSVVRRCAPRIASEGQGLLHGGTRT
jgi:hypothetical protein